MLEYLLCNAKYNLFFAMQITKLDKKYRGAHTRDGGELRALAGERSADAVNSDPSKVAALIRLYATWKIESQLIVYHLRNRQTVCHLRDSHPAGCMPPGRQTDSRPTER